MNTYHEVLDTQQMAAADQAAIQLGVSAIQLMENAGQEVARVIQKRWAPCKVSVLCGPGNNGGDGFVVARKLKQAGWHVRVGLLGHAELLKNEAAHHAKLWAGEIEPLSPDIVSGAELVVDALFGAGLNRPLEIDASMTLINAVRLKLPIVAIDVPSGVKGDTGEALGAVSAKLTVTFFRKKPAHLLLPGRLLCGEVEVCDIGIPANVLPSIGTNTDENTPDLWLRQFPKPTEISHKYTRGHALLYGGYPVTGASRLAAMAAARAGAGLTSIMVPTVAYPIYATALTSVMVIPCQNQEDIDHAIHQQRITGFLIGPGAGVSKDTLDTTLTMLHRGLPTVLDADAITIFQGKLDKLRKAIVGPCIMTPHEGEFSRLFDISGDKLSRARQAAEESGAIIVLKGNDTIIAAPDGRAVINSNSPATLATAGSGDVLGGIILGLLAQGMEPFLAAAAGVWLHGAAANEFGRGLIAEDLPAMLPKVLQKLLD